MNFYKPIPEQLGNDEPSLTQPGLAMSMSQIYQRLRNHEPIPIVDLRYDKDPTLSDPILDDVDPKHMTPEMLRSHYADHFENLATSPDGNEGTEVAE